MAFNKRTTREIYDEIMNEMQNQTELTELQPELDSSQKLLDDLKKRSQVAAYRIFSWTVAYVISTFEAILENFETDIRETITESIVGNVFWLIAKAKEYQDGDQLVVNEETFEVGYEEIDNSKQIVKFAAIEEQPNGLLLKVRKEDDPLTEDEIERFKSYIQKIKIAGSRILIRSVEPDLIRPYIDIYYQGEIAQGTIKNQVEEVINNYVKNISFNSRFRVIDLVDELQKIEGIVDIEFIKGVANSPASIDLEFTRTYSSYAGWNEIENFNNINYIPKQTY